MVHRIKIVMAILTLLVVAKVNAYDFTLTVSKGDNAVVFGPENDASLETPEQIHNMMVRWAGNGFTSLTWREVSWLFGEPRRSNEFISNPFARSTLMGNHFLMADVANSFDGISLARQEALALGMDFWVWEEVWNDGMPAGLPVPADWPVQSRYLNEHPEVEVVDRNGNPQYGVRELAYPLARQQKIDEFVDMVTRFNVKKLIVVLRTEMALVLPAPATGDTMGFNQPVVDEMLSLYGVNILTDSRFDVDDSGFDINDSMVENWRVLRGGYLTQFLREVRIAMDAIDPTIKIGIYCNQGEYLGPPFGNMKQDWRTWVDEGLVDRFYMGSHMGSCFGGCGTGYLSDRVNGIGVLPYSTVYNYIQNSSHPAITLIKGGKAQEPFSDGSTSDSLSQDTGFAKLQNQVLIQSNLDTFGYMGYVHQDFDDFPVATFSRANGGLGSVQYIPSINTSPGWWEKLSDGNDLLPVIQNTIIHGNSGNAAKVTSGGGKLTARRSASPSTIQINQAIDSGFATFEFWFLLDNTGSDIFASIGNFNVPSFDGVGLIVLDSVVYVKHPQPVNFLSTGVNLSSGVWHRIRMEIDFDNQMYSVFTGDQADIALASDVNWTADAGFFDNLSFTSINLQPGDSVFYLDDVDVRWHPTMMPPKIGCGDAEHPILSGDFNKDCRVDLADFLTQIGNWMVCTHPVCD